MWIRVISEWPVTAEDGRRVFAAAQEMGIEEATEQIIYARENKLSETLIRTSVNNYDRYYEQSPPVESRNLVVHLHGRVAIATDRYGTKDYYFYILEEEFDSLWSQEEYDVWDEDYEDEQDLEDDGY